MRPAFLYYLVQTWTADRTGRTGGRQWPVPRAGPATIARCGAGITPAGFRPWRRAARSPCWAAAGDRTGHRATLPRHQLCAGPTPPPKRSAARGPLTHRNPPMTGDRHDPHPPPGRRAGRAGRRAAGARRGRARCARRTGERAPPPDPRPAPVPVIESARAGPPGGNGSGRATPPGSRPPPPAGAGGRRPIRQAFGVAVDPRANLIFVTSPTSNNVSAISGQTNRIVATVPVGHRCPPRSR
jgi:hypothetical protein